MTNAQHDSSLSSSSDEKPVATEASAATPPSENPTQEKFTRANTRVKSVGPNGKVSEEHAGKMWDEFYEHLEKTGKLHLLDELPPDRPVTEPVLDNIVDFAAISGATDFFSHLPSFFETKFPWTKEHYISPDQRHYPAVIRFLEELEHITHCNTAPHRINFLRIVTNDSDIPEQKGLQIYLTGKTSGDFGGSSFGGKYDDSGMGAAVAHAKKRAIDSAAIMDTAEEVKMVRQIDNTNDERLSDKKNYRKIFEPHDANFIIDKVNRKNRSDERLVNISNLIRKTSPYKPMALVSDAVHAQKILESLRQQFPNFETFITNLQNYVSLSTLGGGELIMDPVLFVGPPGIGKTSILKHLAKIFSPEPPLFQINYGSSQSGAMLSGSDVFWDNTREGELFNLLVHGKCANPMVFLDEVDKTSTDTRHSPIGPLYYLLEKSTAVNFKDLSVPNFKVDASFVQWFAAANDANAIDTAILSRFEIFEILAPDAAQMKTIARNIYHNLLKTHSWGHNFDHDVNDECLEKIQHGSPRDARREILAACARASEQKRFFLRAEDFQATTRTHKIGF